MRPEMMIPVTLGMDEITAEDAIRVILRQHERYGFDHFIMECPYGGCRSTGFPAPEEWDFYAQKYVQVRDAVAPYGIRCGWWLAITIKSGLLEGATPITRADGTTSPIANCPMDPTFRKRFAAETARFAKTTKPTLIITEDDYSINAAAGKQGCFCKYHIQEFNRRHGTSYTRETLVEALSAGTPEAAELEKSWRTLKKDSLVLLASDMRRALDEETPEIPLGYMQAGNAYLEDNATYDIAKAMAGPRHTPFSRIFGTFYAGTVPYEIPFRLSRCLWARQNIPEPFTFIHESDTFPHTRWFNSGSAMNTLMAGAYSMGFVGSTFQTQQLLDDPDEESDTYGLMYRRERKRFETLCDVASRCRVYGARLLFDPADGAPYWSSATGRMGIPYTTLDSSVTFWEAKHASHASDEEILKTLSGGVILDGEAAKVLCKRGYGQYLGVDVGEDVSAGNLQYDIGAREVIREPFLNGSKARTMPASHIHAPGGKGMQLRLTVTDDGCEVLTDICTYRFEKVCAGTTRFINSLGGHVVVMGETVAKNRSQSLLNFRRQRLLQSQILWCGGDFVMARNVPDIFVIENRPTSEDADFYAMLTLENLCDDTPAPFELYLPEAWRKCRVCVMDAEGAWRSADAEPTAEGILLREEAAHFKPVYLLLKKA